MVGEIISESWARSYRYTRARSSESAIQNARLHKPSATPVALSKVATTANVAKSNPMVLMSAF